MNFLITQCGSPHWPVPRNQNIIVQDFFLDSKLVLVKGAKVSSGKTGDFDCEISWVDRDSGLVKVWRCGTITRIHEDNNEKADINEWERSAEFIGKNSEVALPIIHQR